MSIETHASKCRILTSDREGRDCNCDGYHTFGELYDHRIELFITLCRVVKATEKMRSSRHFVWRSRAHHDGSECPGWFIVGMGVEPSIQITYHLPMAKWHETNFALTLGTAPKWDGHTSDDVLERLKSL